MKNLVERLKKDKKDILMFAILTVGCTAYSAHRFAWTDWSRILAYYVSTLIITYAISIFAKHIGEKISASNDLKSKKSA